MNFEICTGCGSTETLEELRARAPNAISCCPERKMVPAREVWKLAYLDRPAAEPRTAPTPEQITAALKTIEGRYFAGENEDGEHDRWLARHLHTALITSQDAGAQTPRDG